MAPQIQTQISLPQTLHLIDWIVFSIVLLITVGAVLKGSSKRKQTSSESEHFLDLLIMGRRLTLPDRKSVV